MGAAGTAVVAGAAGAAIAASIAAISQSTTSLESRATLADAQADVNRLNELIGSLPDLLEDIRDRGYEFGRDLEQRINKIYSDWEAILPRVDDEIYRQSVNLSEGLAPMQDAVYRLSARRADAGVESQVSSVEGQIRQLESRARSAEDVVESLYSSISTEAYALQSELNRIDAILDRFEEAAFELAEEESPVAAVKAKYDVDGKDDPEGFLFLTDKRLIFEQKEEVVIKKVLFIPTEKELVQEVLVEVDEDDIESVKASKKGLGGHEDHLDLAFKQGDVTQAHFHIDGQDADTWHGWLSDVMSGKIEEDTAVTT